MPGDLPLQRPACHLRAGCAPADVCSLCTRRPLGRLRDVTDVLAWPVLTTLASLAPRRLSRLIRSDGNPNREADPIG